MAIYLDQTKYGGNMQNHEKLYFWSRDTCAVKNPSKQDFRFKYDSIWWTVPAGAGVTGEAWKKERYLCNRYMELMCQNIIGQLIQEKGEKALAKLADTNGNLLIDKYLENRQIWDKMPKLNDIELTKKIWKDLWLGVVERYGVDVEEVDRDYSVAKDTNIYQELSEELGDVMFNDAPQAQTTVIASEDTIEAPQVTPTLEQEVTTNG